MDQESTQEAKETVEEMGEDPDSQVLQQMAKYSQLKDLLYAHHITGTNNFFYIVKLHFCVKCKRLTFWFCADVIRWLQPREDSPRQRSLYFFGNCLQRRVLRNI